MVVGQKCILLMRSIHFIMRAEKAFKRQQIWNSVVPVPRQLKSECGMAIEFQFHDLKRITRILLTEHIQKVSMHRKAEHGFSEITPPEFLQNIVFK